MTLSENAEDEDQIVAADAAMTIYVCITCRRASDPEDGIRQRADNRKAADCGSDQQPVNP